MPRRPTYAFTYQIIAIPDRIEIHLRQFLPKTLGLSLLWTFLFLAPLALAILQIGDGIAAVLAVFGLLLCLVPLSVANRSFTRAQITFEPDTVRVKLRHLFTWKSTSAPLANFEGVGCLYRSHGGPDFAIQLAQKRITLIFFPIPADVATVLENLSSHAKALNHPAFTHLHYSETHTLITNH